MAALLLGLVMLGATVPADALDCETLTFEDRRYDVCTVELPADDLRLWWADDKGRPLRSFANIAALGGGALGFAMNAGMFHEDRSAVGHLIVNRVEQAPLVTSAGPGNFGMLPNGVFCWDDTKAMVIESRAYARRKPACRYATQSGPMLVIDGKLHHRFLADGTSLRIRNGVGVRADGETAVFAISHWPVNFHSFARLFRDRLETPDALYLDGSISRLYAPSLGRTGLGGSFGPMVGVVVPE